MNITNVDLVKLGFREETVPALDSGLEDVYYYYVYEVNGRCILMSDASDDCGGNFTIEFDECNDIKISDLKELKKLIKIIKNNTIG